MDATKSNGDEISCVFMSIDDPKELQMWLQQNDRVENP